MKKLMITLLAAVLLITGVAFARPASTQEAEESSFASAVPSVDSLVMCMVERGYSYRPASDDFFWASLYKFSFFCSIRSMAKLCSATALP